MNKNEIDVILAKLMNHYNVFTLKELAKTINTSQQAISSWKARNSINAIKKKCHELGIYNEIFGDQNMQTINNVSGGQVAQVVKGNQNNNPSAVSSPFDDLKKVNNIEIDNATYSLFLEAFKKAIENNDLKGLRIHLMEY